MSIVAMGSWGDLVLGAQRSSGATPRWVHRGELADSASLIDHVAVLAIPVSKLSERWSSKKGYDLGTVSLIVGRRAVDSVSFRRGITLTGLRERLASTESVTVEQPGSFRHRGRCGAPSVTPKSPDPLARRLVMISHDDHEVVPCPGHIRPETGLFQPPELINHSAGFVVRPVNRRHGDIRSVGKDDVTEDESPAVAEATGDPLEQVCLSGSVEVMYRERRHDEVEAAPRQWLFEPLDPKVGVRQSLPSTFDHRRALVDPDEASRGVHRQHPGRCLTGADAKFEDLVPADADGCPRDLILQVEIAGNLRDGHVEVRVGIEVMLLGVAVSTVRHGTHLATWRQRRKRRPRKSG